MRAALLTRYGDNNAVNLAEVSAPGIFAAELPVPARTAGVNPLAMKVGSGQGKAVLRCRLPTVLGNDLAGVVTRVGAHLRGFKAVAMVS